MYGNTNNFGNHCSRIISFFIYIPFKNEFKCELSLVGQELDETPKFQRIALEGYEHAIETLNLK